jgi:DNA invertase Pin-like site-specific DNA recombinase
MADEPLEDPQLVERVDVLEGQITVLVARADRWERQHRRFVDLAEELIARSDALAMSEQAGDAARARDYRSIARCLLGVLADKPEPLAFYLTPEV